MTEYVGRHAFMPSTRWRDVNAHWHAYLQRDAAFSGRVRRLDTPPLEVLYTPDEVAGWIEGRIRELGERRSVWAAADCAWVEIGDSDDLAHLYQEHVLIAASGDSIYTDIYSESARIELFLEVVNVHDCPGH